MWRLTLRNGGKEWGVFIHRLFPIASYPNTANQLEAIYLVSLLDGQSICWTVLRCRRSLRRARRKTSRSIIPASGGMSRQSAIRYIREMMRAKVSDRDHATDAVRALTAS
jgi:hypothetical protein